MAIPSDWSASFSHSGQQVTHASDLRAICPRCKNAATFTQRSLASTLKGASAEVHLVMECNYSGCKKMVYVKTSIDTTSLSPRPDAPFFMYPSQETVLRPRAFPMR